MKNQKEIDNNQKNGGGVNFYKEEIISIVSQIENEKYLKMIYGFANRLQKE